MRKFTVILLAGIVFLSGCSTGKNSMTEESSSNSAQIEWAETLPLGFKQITSLRSEKILFPDFGYKIFDVGTYDCPSGQPRCLRVSVISAKGCPTGIYATIVGRSLEEKIYTDKKVLEYVDMTPPIFSQVDNSPLQPNEKRVLNFKETPMRNDSVSFIPGIEVIGCNKS